MLEKIDTKEIFAIAHKSKWSLIKRFIKKIIQKTINKNSGYELVGLDIRINSSIKNEFSKKFTDINQLKILDKIDDFKIISLYQSDEFINNHLNLSTEKEIIILIAKFMGPDLEYAGTFDFSIEVDSINPPYFTNSVGQVLSPKEFVDLFNKISNSKSLKNNNESITKHYTEIEKQIYEKLKNKKAVWGGSETQAFKKWKKKINNDYHKKNGKNPYYNGNPTKNYEIFLTNMLKGKVKRIIIKNDIETEKQIYEKLKNKKAVWGGSETQAFKKWKKKINNDYHKKNGKNPYYNGNPTKNYEIFLTNMLKGKVKRIIIKNDIETEKQIYEKLKNKKAVWGGSETQAFKKWKKKINNDYHKKTGKNPYYNGKPTKNYNEFLENY